MTDKQKGSTMNELATEYMQAYHSERGISGEDSRLTQSYKACWDLFSVASRRIRYSKDLVPQANSQKQSTLKDFCTKFVQMLLDKFIGKNRRNNHELD